MQRVLVGMSGGVDSSAAAALLLDAGVETAGVTLRLYDGAAEERMRCGSSREERDAAAVAAALGRPLQQL